MNNPKNRSFGRAASLSAVTAAALLLILSVGQRGVAQSLNNDVHVMPGPQRTGHALAGRSSMQPLDTGAGAHAGLLTVQVDLVLVPVTVTDAMNRPITGLRKENFAIYEDEKPQNIRYFSAEETPISVGIILDVSGTMANKINAAREALAEFFKNAHPDDEYFVITFADHPQLLADATRSVGEIEASLTTVEPYGYTALLDAINMGLAKLRSARYQRRALLIISDGIDNASHHTLRDTKSAVEESGAEVYAIGLFDGGLPLLRSVDGKFGKRVLSQVTEASGGRTLTVDNLSTLPAAARTISEEMRSQYVLGYKPSNPEHNGRWRKIKVKVAQMAGRSHDSARLNPAYKKGYTAARQPD